MYNLVEKTITLDGHTEPIVRFEVWFQTPVGLCTNVDIAVQALESMDFDPRISMVPVTVAIASNTLYEVMSK